jgi:small redox-active disulfide protein 2
MKIEVLGPGCPKCVKLHEHAVKAVANLGLDAEVEKVSDIIAMTKMGLWATPGLAIDGKVVSQGRLLSVPEIETVLKSHAPQDR